MTKKHRKKLSLILILLSVLFFNSILIEIINLHEEDNRNTKVEELFGLNVAAPINYNDIIQNATNVFRLFESINFTLDTSTDFTDADHVTMQIIFSNDAIGNYDMTLVSPNEFYYEYVPNYNTPLGFQNVSFLIYDNTNTLLNDQTTYTNFTIQTNCLAVFNSSEYYIGDTIYAELIVNNFTSNSITYEFQWDLTIVDSTDELTQINLIDLQSNKNHFILPIDNETFQDVNKIYYLKVNMTDTIGGKTRAAYFPFNLKNTDPIITSEISLSQDELYRTENCIVSINATDVETIIENLTITLSIDDSEGNTVIEKDLRHRGDNLFSTNFEIPSNSPIGQYKVEISASDEDNGIDSKSTFLTVKNNLPEIHSYRINGLSMNQGINIFYGRDLLFTFNVSDTEGIAYIKIALLNGNNEWYNITSDYLGENTEVKIRTIDLIGGLWYVYIYAIDTDGDIVSLTDDYDMAPQAIRIVPDVLSEYIPWIVFSFGLILGLLIGIGVIYKYFKSKYGEPQTVSTKTKEMPSKKKTSKKKPEPLEVKEDLKDKESKEPPSEKEEIKEITPKRKIKRKL